VRELETGYLIVGAGAAGMAFADALLARTNAEVVLVDRRHAPGGHWLDAYPFVRLHQPSAYYGVDSRRLGHDRIDEHGPNAGFYERASAAEICAYYGRVLDDLRATGRAAFLGASDYRGDRAGLHRVVSLLDGEETSVRVRRRLVDATYVQSEIPARHLPPFLVEEGVRLVPPNGLVDLDEPARRFTVVGAGKTATDTCSWLLDQGVDPGRIRWLKSREPWFFDRAFTQPLDRVGTYMQLQARWVEAAAAAEDGHDFAHRLEDAGVFVRIDETVEPLAFRGATISRAEVEALRSIEQVERACRVLGLGRTSIRTDAGELPAELGELYVDCTARGVRATEQRPVFADGRITLQYVNIGFVPWSSATIGVVESLDADDDERNRLCPPVVFTGDIADVLRMAHDAMRGQGARTRQGVVAEWNAGSRLNPAAAAPEHAGDPAVAEALVSLSATVGAALENLGRRAA
jgi:hypothetical protein